METTLFVPRTTIWLLTATGTRHGRASGAEPRSCLSPRVRFNGSPATESAKATESGYGSALGARLTDTVPPLGSGREFYGFADAPRAHWDVQACWLRKQRAVEQWVGADEARC